MKPLLFIFFAFSISLKISSFNIYSGKNIDNKYNIRKQGELLLAQKFDFVGLQEVDNKTLRSNRDDQLKILSDISGMSYYRYLHLVDYSNGQYGIGVLSKHPILEAFNLKYQQRRDLEQRGLIGVRVKIDNSHFWLLNTHFSHVDEATQLSSANQLVEKVKDLEKRFPKDKFMVSGDFNVLTGSRVEKVLSSFFIDTWKKCGNNPQGFTFNSRTPTKRIDYIYSKFDISSCKSFVINATISDHRPISLEISI